MVRHAPARLLGLLALAVVASAAGAQVLERSEGATEGSDRGRCELHRGGEVHCVRGSTRRRFELPEAVSIEVLDDSLYWLDDSGDVRWIERWDIPDPAITLIPGAAQGAGATLEGGATRPPSMFENSPRHLLCVREDRLRCWSFHPGMTSRARASNSVHEVQLPSDVRRALVGPPLVIQRADGSIAALDQTQRQWLELSEASFIRSLRAGDRPTGRRLLAADRRRFTVRLANGTVAMCNVQRRIICTAPYGRSIAGP